MGPGRMHPYRLNRLVGSGFIYVFGVPTILETWMSQSSEPPSVSAGSRAGPFAYAPGSDGPPVAHAPCSVLRLIRANHVRFHRVLFPSDHDATTLLRRYEAGTSARASTGKQSG